MAFFHSLFPVRNHIWIVSIFYYISHRNSDVCLFFMSQGGRLNVRQIFDPFPHFLIQVHCVSTRSPTDKLKNEYWIVSWSNGMQAWTLFIDTKWRPAGEIAMLLFSRFLKCTKLYEYRVCRRNLFFFFFGVLMRLRRKYEQCVSSEHTIQSDIANKRKLLCYCMWVLDCERKKENAWQRW